jgi:hypothetical protein
MGSLLRTAGLQYIGIISGVKQFNILTVFPNRDSIYSVMSHKNVAEVMWYILSQSSSLYNNMSMVSGVRKIQKTAHRKQMTEDKV